MPCDYNARLGVEPKESLEDSSFGGRPVLGCHVNLQFILNYGSTKKRYQVDIGLGNSDESQAKL